MVVGELWFFVLVEKSYYGKEAEDSGNGTSNMAIRQQQIMANAPKIMSTDRWHGKTSHLWRAGVRNCWVLRPTSKRPVDLTSKMYFTGW
jgi:hypothetical protein